MVRPPPNVFAMAGTPRDASLASNLIPTYGCIRNDLLIYHSTNRGRAGELSFADGRYVYTCQAGARISGRGGLNHWCRAQAFDARNGEPRGNEDVSLYSHCASEIREGISLGLAFAPDSAWPGLSGGLGKVHVTAITA